MGWVRDRFEYTVGNLRRIATNYYELRELTERYGQSFEEPIMGGWIGIIDDLVAFDTAIEAVGLEDKFGSCLKGTNMWGLSRADYEEMCKFLNKGGKDETDNR